MFGYTTAEALQFVLDNDVKFIRLSFCDLLGAQKNISITAKELSEAFEHGVAIDGSSINGFSTVEQSDLLLFPISTTLHMLPWRPGGSVVRFYCNICNPDYTTYSGDTRHILETAVSRCQSMGYSINMGAECEFYLFKTNEQGEPTQTPVDFGGYLDMSPLDKCEDIRREICLCLDEMGISPETSHHEQGPGQNEIDFKFSNPLSCADNLLTFKSVVKALSAQYGLFASFMPKPLKEYCGNGLHINISLSKDGGNLFSSNDPDHQQITHCFLAGVLNRAAELSLFLNPIANSYDRLGKDKAPKYVSWGTQNRSQLIRIPASDTNNSRIELRSPDPSVNPYIAFALLVHAGLDGIEKSEPLQEENNLDLYTANSSKLANLTHLPKDIGEAISLYKQSKFIKAHIPTKTFEKYLDIKMEEFSEFESAIDEYVYHYSKFFEIT